MKIAGLVLGSLFVVIGLIQINSWLGLGAIFLSIALYSRSKLKKPSGTDLKSDELSPEEMARIAGENGFLFAKLLTSAFGRDLAKNITQLMSELSKGNEQYILLTVIPEINLVFLESKEKGILHLSGVILSIVQNPDLSHAKSMVIVKHKDTIAEIFEHAGGVHRAKSI